MVKKKTRDSNIELLRIIAMFMIVVFHIVLHAVNYQLTDAKSIELLNNGLFNKPIFYKKLLLLMTFIPLGKVGDTIFILISGYFMVGRKNIDLIKISKKLLFSLAFVATVLVIGSTITYFLFPYEVISLTPITNVNLQSWFIGYYLAIMIMATLFLNKFISKLNKKQYLTFLLVLFSIITFGWTGLVLNNLADELRTLVAGVFVYSLGGYIKKYKPFDNVRTYILILIWIGIYGLFFLSYYNVANSSIDSYLLSNTSKAYTQAVYTSFYDYSLFIIILGISLFELFKRIKIRSNRVINYIASTTLTIYLLHDTPFVRSVFRIQDWITLLYYHPLEFIGSLLLWGLGVFVVGIIIHSVYLGIGKLCIRFKKIAIKA